MLLRLCFQMSSKGARVYPLTLSRNKMTYLNRTRKSRLRSFKRIYGLGEFQFDNLNVEPVHQIPNKIEDGSEFDYWVANSFDLFLVTFEKSKEEKIFYLRTNPRSHIYMRV